MPSVLRPFVQFVPSVEDKIRKLSLPPATNRPAPCVTQNNSGIVVPNGRWTQFVPSVEVKTVAFCPTATYIPLPYATPFNRFDVPESRVCQAVGSAPVAVKVMETAERSPARA